MDRRSLAAILVSFVLIQVWFYFFGPGPSQAAVDTGSAPVAALAPVAAPVAPSVTPAAPAVAITAPIVDIPFKWCTVDAVVSTDGASLRSVWLTDWNADFEATPIWMWIYRRASGATSGGWKPYHTDTGPAPVLTAHSTMLAAGAGPTGSVLPRYEKLPSEAGTVALRTVDDGIEIRRTMRARPDCNVDVTTTWTNTNGTSYVGDLWLSAFDRVDTEGATIRPVRPIGMANGKAIRWASVPDELDVYPGPVRWFGLHDHYFGAYAVGGADVPASLEFGPMPIDATTTYYGVNWVAPVTLAAGQSRSVNHVLFVGSKQIEILSSVAAELKDAIDLGWFGLFVGPLLWLLKFVHSFVGNWGVAIIGLTFLVKMAVYPLQRRAFLSGQLMQAMQPKIKEIQAKYADNPEELQRQTMALWRDGASPLGGCLPMIVQIPIFISLYTMIGSSVEIYQQPFLYLQDLASVDPIGVLPLLSVGAMFLQQRSMPTGNLDPAQQQVMQMMPLIFGVIMFSVPSGLVVYSLANIVLSMLQQWWMKRNYAPPPAVVAA